MRKKVKIARKIRSHKDIKNHVPIFLTEAWKNRKEAIRKRVQNNIKKIQQKKNEREKFKNEK